jgi:hypothetical protein
VTQRPKEADFKVASVLSWLSAGIGVFRLAGLDHAVLMRLQMLLEVTYEAITDRGAKVIEVADAIRNVRVDARDTVRPRQGNP